MGLTRQLWHSIYQNDVTTASETIKNIVLVAICELKAVVIDSKKKNKKMILPEDNNNKNN